MPQRYREFFPEFSVKTQFTNKTSFIWQVFCLSFLKYDLRKVFLIYWRKKFDFSLAFSEYKLKLVWNLRNSRVETYWITEITENSCLRRTTYTRLSYLFGEKRPNFELTFVEEVKLCLLIKAAECFSEICHTTFVKEISKSEFSDPKYLSNRILIFAGFFTGFSRNTVVYVTFTSRLKHISDSA